MKSKAPLMLMEQMVMLLVFAIAAALCLTGFVKSSEISEMSRARDMAVIEAQNAAEAVRSGSEEDYFNRHDAFLEETGGIIYYSEEWGIMHFDPVGEDYYEMHTNENPFEGASYYLELKYTDSGLDNMVSAEIAVYTADGEALFSIPAARQTKASGKAVSGNE